MSDLREKAEKATQGEWLLHTDTVVGLEIPQYARGEDWIIAETFGAGADIDAAYIAAVHPQAVIALLDERDALAARVEELEGAIKQAAIRFEAIASFVITNTAMSPTSINKYALDARQALGDHNDG